MLLHEGGVNRGRVTMNRFVELVSASREDLRVVPAKAHYRRG